MGHSSTHQLEEFDWFSLGNFQPMANTMDLASRIEEEPASDYQADTQSQEEHYILSAIDDDDNVEYDEREGILVEPLVMPTDVPPPMFANVVFIEPPMDVQVAPIDVPNPIILQEVPAVDAEVYSVRDSNSVVSSLDDDEWMDMDEEVGAPLPAEPYIVVAPPQEVEIVDVVPPVPHEADVVEVLHPVPASPISILSEDDDSLSDFRVHTVVTPRLRWDPVRPRNFLTRPESRTLRRYIRYLRSQIQTMRMRLQIRIDHLRRYHGDIFHSNFDFGTTWGY